ncbi:DUF5955 family protein [Actinomycetes bacterium KLBMP 9797]
MSTFNIDNVNGSGNVFGDHNTVVNGRVQLATLEQQVRAYYRRLHDPRAAAAAVEALKSELALARPRRERILESLSVITASAAGISAVLEAVEGVRAALF